MSWAGARSSTAPEVQLDGCSALLHGWDAVGSGPGPAVLWIHGGGLVMGDARMDGTLCDNLAKTLGIPVVSAQYRLAPEFPFQTPIHDCRQVFDWKAAQPGIDPRRIVVAGQSAGGGLAAALCQHCVDTGPYVPSFQVLIYPMLDNTSAQGSGPNDRAFRLWDRKSNAFGWSSYLRGHDPENPPPFSVPARVRDCHGLPPAWVGVGDLDLFYEEDLVYAHRLASVGIDVQTEIIPGAYHGFDIVDTNAPPAQRFIRSYENAIAEHLAVG
jgi:acetyl esterase/lipase